MNRLFLLPACCLLLVAASASRARADTVVVFNEILYHPATNETVNEWVELRNLLAVDVDLSGWSLSGMIDFTFPSNSIIKGGQQLVVARVPAALMGVLGTNVHGPFTGRLDNDGGLLRLRNNSGRVMDELEYDTEGDWPVAPDGSGVSLAKRDPDTASGVASSWTASEQIGGTPGARNFAAAGFAAPPGLVSWWPFNEPSGSSIGDQAGANAGSLGAGVSRVASTLGGALSFNGTSDAFANVGAGAGFNVGSGLTIEAVLMPGWSTTNTAVIFRKAPRRPPSYRDAVLTNSPSAYWRLGDASATIADSGPSARTGAATAGVLLNQPSLIASDPGNGAMRFTGAERITVNGFEKIGAAGYTVEFWVRPHALPTGCCQNLVGDGEAAGDYFMMNYILGPQQGLVGAIRPHFGPGNSPVSLTGGTALQVNQTYHIVTTWDTAVAANNAVIYINGVASSVGTISRNVPAAGTTGNNRVYIGKDDRDTTDGTETLDEVALYSRPLTAAEVAAHYEAGTIADFDTTQGNAIQLAFQDDGNNAAANPPVAAGKVLSFGLTVGGVYSELDMPLDGASGRPTLAALQNGQPHHIAATFDSASGLKAIFVDGTLRFSTTLAGGLNGTNGAPATLGNSATNGSAPFAGTLDEMAYWSRALSASEVAAHWGAVQAGRDYFTPDPAGSAARLAFNEVSASTNAAFWLELVNYGTNSVPLAGFVIVRDGPDGADSEYVFPAGPPLGAGAYLALTNGTLGFLPVDGDRLFLLTPARDRVLDSLVVTRGARARVPAGTGPFYRPTTATPGGANNVVFRDEIVINEILYHHALLPALATNLPPRESPEAWVEVFNRSGNAVDLTGWEIDGGIQYRFTPGQMLGPGAFLVVAEDAPALRALYPAIAIVGNFSGRLSGSSDRLVLKDPAGNPADEVTYHDRAPWPEYADGGGSSLELCDARLDNSRPEAWADSDERGKTGWLTNSYRMVASTAGSGQPTVWADFIFGLLGPGECLIDDISVIETPAGTPVQLVANGNFSSGLSGWRVLGTHGRSFLDTDPENPGNSVLHVVATGPQEHMHNHVERTLNNQRLPQNGLEYQISYRVKWLAGNNLLNTRLYFNRCARTIALPMPALNGTPGAPNDDHGRTGIPTFSGLGHQPVIPQPGAPVTVTVTAQAPGGVNGVQLFRSVNGGAASAVAMTALGGGRYSGVIPGQSAGAIVQFWVVADGAEADAAYPPGGPDSGALYQVADGQANLSVAHNVRIIITAANRDLMHASTNVMSNDRLPGTVVFDESRAYYNCGVRLKGSERGRPNSARVSWHLEFPADDPFRGVHPFMLVDRSGAGDATSNKQQEMLIKHILLRAGGIPSTHPDICRVIAPNPAHTDSAMLAPRAEDEFLDTYFESGGDGGMWELELIYYPNAGQTNAAGYKFVQSSPNNDSVVGTDISDVGNDKEIYRYNFIIKNHRAEDDYAPFMNFARRFSIPSGPLLEAQAAQVMDVNEWARTFAMESLCGVGDSYTFGNDHNLFMYRRASDGKFVPLPTDMDFSFNRAANSSIIGNRNLATILSLTPNRRCIYAHVLDLIATSYNTGYMAYWVPHYASFAPGQNYSSVLSSYMPTRIATAISEINNAGGNAAFAITSATNLTVSNNLVVISGTAPVTARTIRVNGYEYPITWTSLSAWTIRVPVSEALQVLNVAGYDIHGQPITNFNRTVTVTYNGPAPDPAGFVAINEIMYNPVAPDASYLELINTSTNVSFDLSHWRLNGLDFTFPAGSILTNRGLLVLAGSMPAYAAAYGTAAPVPFATYAGSLQNDGETLTLFRPGPSPGTELVVDKVCYESLPPWPARPNGLGGSLQLIDATQDNSRVANWTDGTGWRLFSFTASSGPSAATAFSIFLANAGELYVDNLALVHGSTPGAGPNLLANGSFEEGLAPWIAIGNHASSTVVTGIALDGTNSLRLSASGIGAATSSAITQMVAGVTLNTPHTVSFWFLPSASTTTGLNFRVTSSLRSLVAIDVRPALPTPGLANAVAASISAFPPLWLNEVQPENPAGLMDNQGEREPWIELYNAGTSVLSLAGHYLSDNYGNLTQWAFPPGAQLQPGQFKVVFCDGEPEESTGSEWHAGFRLSPTNGSVALAWSPAGPQLLDYLNYAGIPAGRSYGDFPDGQTCERQEFYAVTPGGTNDSTAAPLTVFINEWMADNSGALINTNHNNLYDDWFELHNPTASPADLRGYFLTDNLGSPHQFEIPPGYVIPPRGFLVVWADGRPDLNTNTDAALHVSFQLSLEGESIGLFGGDGTTIDAVTFGPQYNNISEGRYPDGPAAQWIAPALTPTPGASNALWLNRYPVLAPIPDATAYVGIPFEFTAGASDPDAPPQMLTFSLDPGAPTNATVNAGSGAFSWTPDPAQSDTTNVMTLRVTDNGPLNLSDARTFTVVVRTGILIGGIMPGPGGTISFTVGTIPGKTYRVQYKNDLNEMMWTDLPPDHVAMSSSLVIMDTIGMQPQRFYQVVQLD